MIDRLIMQIYNRVYSHSSRVSHKYFYGLRCLLKDRGLTRPPKNTSSVPWTKDEWRLVMVDMGSLDKLLPNHYYVFRTFADLGTMRFDSGV